jgi:hypothetical protein
MTNTFYENSQYSDTPYGLKLRQTIFETKDTYSIFTATANGSYITYGCANFYRAGQTVTITGIVSNNNLSATADTGFNINNATVLSVTDRSFTVANTLPASNTYTSGGSVTSGSIVIPPNIKRVYAVCIGGGGAGGAARLSTSATITSAFANGVNVFYIANNSFVVGDIVNISGVPQLSGTSLNNSSAAVTSASATQFGINNNITGIGGSGGTAYNGAGAGGGGAGAISAGWTFVSSTATVGSGGDSISCTGSYRPSNSGQQTIYGQVLAGGGEGGRQAGFAPIPGAGLGGAGGGGTASIGGGPSGASYTGSPAASQNTIGYAAGGATSGFSGFDGVSASGGATINTLTGGTTSTSGGRGLIGGGAGSSCTTGAVTGGSGGNGDFYIGGLGGNGTGILFGGGGGGAGYLANGENAVGNKGGNGGLGGGGGGASSNGAFSGKGGDGVIFLYY